MSIEVSDFTENSNISVQFSYPVVDNVIYNNDTSSFFLPNNSVAPNFAYTDGVNNLYISGATIKGYLSSSNIKSNPELVLEHQSSSSDKKFYVVIPLKYDTKATSSLSKLKSGSKVSLDLNKDISQQNTIYHYLSTGVHVFVFDAPISIKPNVLKGQNISGVPTSSAEKKYKITSNTKIEDEVVCSYSDDASTKPAEDKITTTTTYSFAMLFLNIVLISICIHLIIMNDGGLIRKILLGLSTVSFIILFVLTILYKMHTNYMIVTGSLMFTSVVVIVLSIWALMRPNYTLFNKPTVAAPPPVAKPIFGLGFLKKP